MPKTSPYQPLIFRLLHAANGLLVLGSMVTGFWLYNTWDYRFGRLPLPEADSKWLSIHHQIGEIVSVCFAAFLLYSLFAGRRRLIQLKSMKQLPYLNQPSGQSALHRLINTGLLGTLLLSMVSARQFGGAKALMNSEWDNVWYNLHVFAWVSMVVLVVAHVALGLRVGGLPLLQSMVNLQVRSKDSPSQWPRRLANWFHGLVER